jgi:hypothetical protein
MNALAFWMEFTFFIATIGFTILTWFSFDKENLTQIKFDTKN